MKEISAIIIDKDPTANQVIKQYLEENPKIKNFKQFLKLDDGYNYTCKNLPELVLIDIDYGINEVLEITSKISKNSNNSKLILIAKNIDAQLIIKAKKAGISEILTKPYIKNEISLKVSKLINQINYNSPKQNKKVISIFSNKGGIGKTTLAVNLALETANITKEPTVIVDFNSQFGDVGVFLDIKTDFGLDYLLENKEKINKEFLLTNLPKYKDTNLWVLSDSFNVQGVKDTTLENTQDIIDALQSAFSYIVVDLSNSFDLKTIKILDNSDDILFPMVANMPNLRNCQRCLDFFGRIGYDEEKIKLILNRVIETEEIRAENIESTLKKKIFSKIANDYYTIRTAINRGIGVGEVNPDSDISKSVQNLAYSLIKTENEG